MGNRLYFSFPSPFDSLGPRIIMTPTYVVVSHFVSRLLVSLCLLSPVRPHLDLGDLFKTRVMSLPLLVAETKILSSELQGPA